VALTEISKIADLTPDRENARRHNPRNVGMIVDALHEVGAARSIVIDEDGLILAGNATIEAAAVAGIERVQVVDADGETIVAVRRTGLTADAKKRLALFDNRSAELADWNPDQLLADLEGGLDLSGLFTDIELEALTIPLDEVWESAIGGLPSGDRSPFQQMTFTLHDGQVETVKEALTASKAVGDFGDSLNENSNGNALARICMSFLGEHGQN